MWEDAPQNGAKPLSTAVQPLHRLSSPTSIFCFAEWHSLFHPMAEHEALALVPHVGKLASARTQESCSLLHPSKDSQLKCLALSTADPASLASAHFEPSSPTMFLSSCNNGNPRSFFRRTPFSPIASLRPNSPRAFASDLPSMARRSIIHSRGVSCLHENREGAASRLLGHAARL